MINDRFGGPFSGPPDTAYSVDGLDKWSKQLIDRAFLGFEGRTMNDMPLI